MIRAKLYIVFLVLITGSNVFAQDPQYSQYYANVLYLNPGFAGATEGSRAFAISRWQWPGLSASYFSNTFSFDHFVEKINSGVGVLVNTDYITASGLTSYSIGGVYAYHVQLSDKWAFRPGIQATYGQVSVDANKLRFGSQYTNDQGYVGGSNGESFASNMARYFSVESGGLLYSEHAWVGIAAHHMNRPKFSYFNLPSNAPDNRLDMKLSFHGGYKFFLGKRERHRYGIKPSEDEVSITPTLIFKTQRPANQLDAGLYFRYNHLVTGIWYRGIPVTKLDGKIQNNDATTFLVGFIMNGFHVGYSYDATVSGLGLTRAWGAHELSVTYNFLVITHPKNDGKSHRKHTPCPDF